MRSGRLTEIVTIQQKVKKRDPRSGQKIEGYQDLIEIWAAIESFSSKERYQADQFDSEATAKLILRQPLSESGEVIEINRTMRIVRQKNGKTYEITHDAVQRDARQRTIECLIKRLD